MPEGNVDPDSRARTHLANERTFLAWLRTGLSLVALGLASAQFLADDVIAGVPFTLFFSVFLVFGGLLLVILGGVHYLHARDQIARGAFLPSSRTTFASITIATIAGAMALVLVILL